MTTLCFLDLMRRANSAQSSSRQLPLSAFWGAGRRYCMASLSQDRAGMIVYCQPEELREPGDLAWTLWEDTEPGESRGQAVQQHLQKEEKVYILVFSPQHQLRNTYACLSRGLALSEMDINRMPALSSLLGGDGMDLDNFFFRSTPLS